MFEINSITVNIIQRGYCYQPPMMKVILSVVSGCLSICYFSVCMPNNSKRFGWNYPKLGEHFVKNLLQWRASTILNKIICDWCELSKMLLIIIVQHSFRDMSLLRGQHFVDNWYTCTNVVQLFLFSLLIIDQKPI